MLFRSVSDNASESDMLWQVRTESAVKMRGKDRRSEGIEVIGANHLGWQGRGYDRNASGGRLPYDACCQPQVRGNDVKQQWLDCGQGRSPISLRTEDDMSRSDPRGRPSPKCHSVSRSEYRRSPQCSCHASA